MHRRTTSTNLGILGEEAPPHHLSSASEHERSTKDADALPLEYRIRYPIPLSGFLSVVTYVVPIQNLISNLPHPSGPTQILGYLPPPRTDTRWQQESAYIFPERERETIMGAKSPLSL